MSAEIARQEVGTVEVLQGWTPAMLKAQIARERELRSIIIDYYQSCMIEGHHYYRLDDDEKKKPALTKEGALALCHLFKAHPHPEPPVEVWSPDGHYGVRSAVSIIERRSGEIIAEGVGYCSTRESKYAYRMGARTCPKCAKAAIIKGREEFGGGWLCFRKKDGCGAKFKDGDAEIESQPTGRVPNEDLPDQYNTALKMSHKRAMVDASLAIPLVSEIFTQDLEEQIEDRQQTLVTEPLRPPAKADIASETSMGQRPEKPTADEVAQLIELLHRVYPDRDLREQRIREVMEIPIGQAVTAPRIKLTMTRARFTQLEDQATAYALAHAPDDMGEELRETDDVSLTPEPDASPAPESDTQESSEGQQHEGDATAAYLARITADEFPPLETDSEGYVTIPGVRLLRDRAEHYGTHALLRTMPGADTGWHVGQYQYAWVQVQKVAKKG